MYIYVLGMGLATKALAFWAQQEEALGWGKVIYLYRDR